MAEAIVTPTTIFVLFLPLIVQFLGSCHGDHQRLLGPIVSKRALNVAEIVFLRAAYSQGKDFELILTVKMETKHPIGGPFGNKFPAICIIAEL